MSLSDEARTILNWLGEEYVKAGHPNHKVWTFSPLPPHRIAFSELRAHGYIEPFGGRNVEWKLTDFGQRMLLRPEEPTTERPIHVHHSGDLIVESKFTANITGSTIGTFAQGDHAVATGTRTVGATGAQDFAVGDPIDFAILTALEVERKAVCAAFGLADKDRVHKDGRWYWRGKLPLPDGTAYEIVVAQPAEMGQVEAALLAADVIRHWSPRAALLVGIAASTDKDVNLGDVAVGRSIYYYEHGKVTPGATKPQPEMLPADAGLLNHFAGMADWDGAVPLERPGDPTGKSKVHQGIIASGEKVIADIAARDAITAGHRKIIALEMEGFGVSKAMWQSVQRVRFLNIRGICDDGTEKKDDRWHGYAAAAAAAFARHFLSDWPFAARSKTTPAAAETKTPGQRDQQRKDASKLTFLDDITKASLLENAGHADMALVALRRAMEATLREAMSRSGESPENISASNLRKMQARNLIPKSVVAHIEQIRFLGNTAAHAWDGGVLPEDIRSALESANSVALWYLREFQHGPKLDEASARNVLKSAVGGAITGMKVFLCHAHEDAARVGTLYDMLKRRGHAPWMDKRDLLPGQDWEAEIRRVIKNSDFFIACLSRTSVSKRGFVQKEMRYALDVLGEVPPGAVFLIPVKLEPCEAPAPLQRLHWIELDGDAAHNRLFEAIEQLTR